MQDRRAPRPGPKAHRDVRGATQDRLGVSEPEGLMVPSCDLMLPSRTADEFTAHAVVPRRTGVTSPLARRLLVALFVTVNVAYVVWRATSTLNPDWPLYSLLFLVAEVYVIIAAILFYTLLDGYQAPPPPPPLPDALPTIDVFIATYNEDPGLVRMTARAARDMDLPHLTWILDDGRREAMRKVAAELGVGYIARADNAHQKAGNLNNALAQTSGDLVMCLDADNIPRKSFLTRTVGYLTDPAVALVQVPQVFYNTDSFQHEELTEPRRLYHEAALFHHRIQTGAASFQAAFSVGTGAVFRRAALTSIGGFATGSVTEDIHTSMRLHDAGWTIAYRDEALAFLLAPETAIAFHVQRLRWAQGGMQILRRDNPLWRRGLSRMQRLLYFNALSSPFSAYPNLLLYFAPALFLLAGMSPVTIANGFSFPTLIYLLHMVNDAAMFSLLAAPHAKLLLGERYKLVNCPIQLRATFRLLRPAGLSFQVTPKGGHGGVPFDLGVFLLGMTALDLIAVAVGFTRAVLGFADPRVFVLTACFAIFFALICLDSLHKIWTHRQGDGAHLLPVCLRAFGEHEGRSYSFQVEQMGPERLRARSESDLPPELTVHLTEVGLARPVLARIVRATDGRYDLHLTGLDAPTRDTIERFLFDTAFPSYLRSFVDTPATPPALSPPSQATSLQVGGAS